MDFYTILFSRYININIVILTQISVLSDLFFIFYNDLVGYFPISKRDTVEVCSRTWKGDVSDLLAGFFSFFFPGN